MLEFSGQLTTPDRFSYHTGPDPPIVIKGHRAFGARHSLFRIHFCISILLPGLSITEFLDPPLEISNQIILLVTLLYMDWLDPTQCASAHDMSNRVILARSVASVQS